MSRMSKKR